MRYTLLRFLRLAIVATLAVGLIAALSGCDSIPFDSIPFIGGDGDAAPPDEDTLALEEPELSQEDPGEPGMLEEPAFEEKPAVLLRVFLNEAGHVEALFDRPVAVVGGEVKLVSDKGALSRKAMEDPGGYGQSLIFDTNSLEEGGDVVASAIRGVDGGRVISEDGMDAIVDFAPQGFSVEKRLFGSSVTNMRPYVREVRAEEWSVRLYFSTNVRFSENLRLLVSNGADQSGELRLAWESLNAMRNWSHLDNLVFGVPEPSREEAFWLSPVHVYGFSEGDALTDSDERGLPARRGLQPFAVDLTRGAILNDLQRCAYYLSDGDQMRYSFAVSNLHEFLAEDQRAGDVMVRNECLKALSRTAASSEAGLSRNWQYSACVDTLESAYRMGEFYPGYVVDGYPSELRDRWLVADDLVSRPYDLLTLEERILLRDALTHDSCPAFYPQLFYGYWMAVE